MHKKLEAELASLAHSILDMKNKDDVAILQKKALLIYEKLSLLKFVDAYMNESAVEDIKEAASPASFNEFVEEEIEAAPVINKVVESEVVVETIEEQLDEEFDEIVKEEVKETIEEVPELIEDVLKEETIEDAAVELDLSIEKSIEEKPMLTDKQVEAIFNTEDSFVKDDVRDVAEIKFSLEDELKDAISADVATDLFERATKENPVIEEKPETKQRSLNDVLFSNNIQVGLNDRIAFVKHLFEGSQEDFNRVLSQLNSFKTEEEAKSFVIEFVKLDYDWSTKLEFEERLIDLIERKFK